LELSDYFRILRRRGWIIIVVVAITATSAYVFSKLQTPVYRASVSVSINPARADLGLTQSAKWLLRNYVAIVHSEKWARDVIEGLNIDLTPGQLKNNVTVASDDSRFLIQIDVKDFDYGQAARIADAWAQKLVEWRAEENAQQRKEDQVNAYQIDAATGGLFTPNTKVNTGAGAVLGLLLAGVIIFFLEWVESGVVRSAADVERHLGLTILGTIPPAD
jgi:capsular polysaccharide biosynthesis protein